MLRFLIVLVVIAAIVGVGGAWYVNRGADEVTYRTGKVTKADVVSTISSTGTLEPTEVIDVGAQVTGQIAEFGKDANGNPIDHGSPVKAGMLLARIDDSLIKQDLAAAQAQYDAAKAGVQRAQADLKQSEAKRDQAERDWTRAQKLGPSEALAQVTYDTYRAAYESAVAAVAVSQASIAQAQGTVAEAEADLFKQKRNLDYTVINSPADGTIIERRVNVGQTIVSNLSAQSLFLLGKDFHHLQVWVSVNEADVGRVYPGQPVTFTIDAFSNRTFTGTVRKVRPKAEMTQNVVTYVVEVDTENPDLKLMPYMTADVRFETGRRESALTVPNAALRYSPPEDKIVPEAREAEASAQKVEAADGGGLAASGVVSNHPKRKRGGATSKPTSMPATQTGPAPTTWRRATIWVRAGEFLKPIHVKAGPTDGVVTEVRGDGLIDGMDVVTGEIHSETAAAAANTNPFGPPQFGKKGARKGMK